MNHDRDNCVLLFVKYPAPGRVKTRLAEDIGPKETTKIYKNFVIDILATLRSINATIKIFFTPAGAQQQIQNWLGKEYSYVAQSGGTLGEKMKNAFEYVFAENFSKVIIIGSDSPDLPEDFLGQAFSALDSNDVVIGPADDGGYYLIGFSYDHFLPEVFEAISWSSDRVFEQTVNILKQHQRKVYLLPQWSDVDTLADLKSLVSRNKNTAFTKSATFLYLEQNELGDKCSV